MKDPTIFENMKVVLQGAVYDLDLSRLIHIHDRCDRIDLSNMSRRFAVEFHEPDYAHIMASIELEASFEELSAEIHAIKPERAGLRLFINFKRLHLTEKEDWQRLHDQVVAAWGERPYISHAWIQHWSGDSSTYEHRMKLDFMRQINEEHLSDIPEMLERILETLRLLRSSSGYTQ